MSFVQKLKGKRPLGVYFESWSSSFATDANFMDLANIKQPINLVFLAFANPACTYTKNSMNFIGTGLDFSSSFSVVKQAINILKSNTILIKGISQNNIGTLLNDLLVSGQDNYINQLYFSSISGPTTNLFYKTINLGQSTSTINIQGQLNIINLFNTVYTNKTLNLNNNNPNDIGNNCGIVILANNNGYLKTNDS